MSTWRLMGDVPCASLIIISPSGFARDGRGDHTSDRPPRKFATAPGQMINQRGYGWENGSCPDLTPTSSPLWVRRSARGDLLRDEAAVDDQFGAGDEGRFIRGQEQYAVGHFDRLAGAPQRRPID